MKKIDKKFYKAFWKFRKLLVPYFIVEYGKEDIEIAFDEACDYFYKLIEESKK